MISEYLCVFADKRIKSRKEHICFYTILLPEKKRNLFLELRVRFRCTPADLPYITLHI